MEGVYAPENLHSSQLWALRMHLRHFLASSGLEAMGYSPLWEFMLLQGGGPTACSAVVDTVLVFRVKVALVIKVEVVLVLTQLLLLLVVLPSSSSLMWQLQSWILA